MSSLSGLQKLFVVALAVILVGGVYAFWQAFGETIIGVTLDSNRDLREGLVLHYTFDGPDLDLSQTSAEIRDQSGGALHGNWQNFSTSSTQGGRIGQALKFTGFADFVSTADDANIDFTDTEDFTIALWVKPTGSTTVAVTSATSGSSTYSTAGYASWTAPTGITSVDVACWGAGGGGFTGSSAGGGVGGGGGAFASSTVTVTPGNSYTIFIGTGGTGYYGIGGIGECDAATAGGGGGYSFVGRNTIPLFIAGGGGGGGGYFNTAVTKSCSGSGGGGAGGGAVGTAGGTTGGTTGGGGGSQTAGGSAGTGGTCPFLTCSGVIWSGFPQDGVGKTGGGGGNGGGGGYGYYGGGGGGAVLSANPGAGGGGGSSWATSTATATSTSGGSGQTPGNNADSDRSSLCGNGGNQNPGEGSGYLPPWLRPFINVAYAATNDGKNGCVVLLYDGGSSLQALNTTTGVIGQGALFSGDGGFIDVGTADSALKTLSLWVRTSSSTQYLLDLNGSAYLSLSAGTVTATGFTSPTIYVDGTATTTLPSDGDWHHIAVTTNTSINASDMDIGRVEGLGSYTGKMDDVRTYNRALTATEILRLYQQGD